jgi:putative heme-binding domain-containing protein
LHPESAVSEMKAYAMDTSKETQSRVDMLTAIAYVKSEAGGRAMVDVALNAEGAEVTTRARWFVENRDKSYWRPFNLLADLGGSSAKLVDSIVPAFPKAKKEVTVEEVLSYTPDIGRGKRALAQCFMCHKFDKQGIDFGPDLTAFAKANPNDMLIKAIIDPSADISHGFEGVRVKTTDSKTVEGFVLSEGNPLVLRIFGGADTAIDTDKIASREKLDYSFMPSAASLDISAENVGHLVAYLKSL